MSYLQVEVKSTSKKGSRLETRQIMPIAHANQLLYEIGMPCHAMSLRLYEHGPWGGGS